MQTSDYENWDSLSLFQFAIGQYVVTTVPLSYGSKWTQAEIINLLPPADERIQCGMLIYNRFDCFSYLYI